MESQRNIFYFLSDIYDKYGITGFTENKLKLSDLYEEIVSLNKNKMDLQEFCCKLIDREDDYIIYISVCND
tara:strand:+ start:279 stop:491 length:213 start_codon:yes stop_codon:yes gene_type:complete